MPVQYKIDHPRGRILTRCHGGVTFDEVIAHFQELEGDSGCPQRLDVLLDLSGITDLPDHRQVRAVAGEVQRLVSRIEWGCCAIVAPRDAVFGISRMFEMIADAHFASLKVFRAREDAESWLDARALPQRSGESG